MDAHRGDGKRFVVRADEKLTAFLELKSVTTQLTVTTGAAGFGAGNFCTAKHKERGAGKRSSGY